MISIKYTNYAKTNHATNKIAIHRNIFDKNCSSICCCVPLAAAAGLPSAKLNVEVKNPKGKAPIPKDIWKPLSAKPKPGNEDPGSGSVL